MGERFLHFDKMATGVPYIGNRLSSYLVLLIQLRGFREYRKISVVNKNKYIILY